MWIRKLRPRDPDRNCDAQLQIQQLSLMIQYALMLRVLSVVIRGIIVRASAPVITVCAPVEASRLMSNS